MITSYNITLQEFDDYIINGKEVPNKIHYINNDNKTLITYIKDWETSYESSKTLSNFTQKIILRCIVTLIKKGHKKPIITIINLIRKVLIIREYGEYPMYKCSICQWIGTKNQMTLDCIKPIVCCPTCEDNKKVALISLITSLNPLPLLLKSINDNNDEGIISRHS